MESARLFFNMESPLMSYNYTAFIGGALFCRSNNPTIGYYMSNHILLLSNRIFDISLDDIVMFRDKNIFIHKCLSKNISTTNELKRELIENICQGYYISATVNEYYIPNRQSFEKREFYHDILIYGYDLNKNIFYTAGYDKTAHFSTMSCNIDIVLNSILDCLEHKIEKPHFHFFKPKGIETTFNLEKARTSLINYINCKPNKYKVYDGCYGFDAYNNLTKIINESVEKNSIIRKATFHMLWEHKKLMIERLKFMKKLNIDFNDSIIQQYHSVVSSSKTVENLYIKYNLNKNQNIIEKINENISNISELEYNLFEQLINQI